jgi:hypothetical protein
MLASIKQVEQYISRLRLLLEQAKKEGATDIFQINSEVRNTVARGKLLVERYNELARLQKEDREYLIAHAKREEQLAMKTIRANLNRYLPKQPQQED